MPTGGTYNFQLTRDDIIKASFRLCGVFGAGEAPPAEDITNAAQALNIIVKEMALEGLPLWCLQEVSVPLTTGVSSYDISAITGQTLPLRILDGFLRGAAGTDVHLPPTSRFDYDKLGGKASTGTPVQVYYDPALGAGTLHFYPVPADSLSTYHAVAQRQIQDFNLSTDNPDFPQEAFRLLKWCLADEIALEYQTPVGTRQEINQKSVALKKGFFDAQQEQASVTFMPTVRT